MNKIIEAATPEEAIKEVNKHRLNNPCKWIFIEVHIGGAVVLIKSYNKSHQIIKRNGINYPAGMDLSAKEWKAQVLAALKG